MKRICVFCGSSPGGRPEYMQEAEQLGHLLVRIVSALCMEVVGSE